MTPEVATVDEHNAQTIRKGAARQGGKSYVGKRGLYESVDVTVLLALNVPDS